LFLLHYQTYFQNFFFTPFEQIFILFGGAKLILISTPNPKIQNFILPLLGYFNIPIFGSAKVTLFPTLPNFILVKFSASKNRRSLLKAGAKLHH